VRPKALITAAHRLHHDQRRPDVRPEAWLGSEEVMSRHTYHSEGSAVDGYRAPDHIRRSRKATLPERVAQDEHRTRPGRLIILWSQDPPSRRANAEDVEVVPGCELALDAVRDGTVGQVDAG
jgi:hypothetical protein